MSCDADNLGEAERVEAVDQGDADVDLGGLAVTSCVGSPGFSELPPQLALYDRRRPCVRPFVGHIALGQYGIRGLGSKHQTELEALHVTLISPTPICPIDFIQASASPAFSR